MFPNSVYNEQEVIRKVAAHPGGFIYLFFLPVSQLHYLGDFNPSTGIIDVIAFKAGNPQIFYAECPATSRGYSEEQQEGNGGEYFNITVNAVLPFTDQDRELNLKSMLRDRYILLVWLPNNIIKVVGSEEDPAQISQSFGTGTSVTDVPGTALQWTWQYPDRAPMLNIAQLPNIKIAAGDIPPI